MLCEEGQSDVDIASTVHQNPSVFFQKELIMGTYYFITVFQNYDEYGPHGMRCWGFFSDFEEAHKTIRLNMTDLWETIYNYGVVEEYYQGIGNYNFRRWFYKYNYDKNEYELIEEPNELRHYVGFAIG